METDTNLNVALHGLLVFEATMFVFSLISKWGSLCRLSAAICEFACRKEDDQSSLFSKTGNHRCLNIFQYKAAAKVKFGGSVKKIVDV